MSETFPIYEEDDNKPPIIPSVALLAAVKNPQNPPDWALRDGGFCVKDRSMRLGAKDWLPIHHERWKHIQNAHYITGYYRPSCQMWFFYLDSFTFEMQSAYRYLDSEKARKWLPLMEAWQAHYQVEKGLERLQL